MIDLFGIGIAVSGSAAPPLTSLGAFSAGCSAPPILTSVSWTLFTSAST
jgi:hypothetical protein